jgi:hypothetical protein
MVQPGMLRYNGFMSSQHNEYKSALRRAQALIFKPYLGRCPQDHVCHSLVPAWSKLGGRLGKSQLPRRQLVPTLSNLSRLRAASSVSPRVTYNILEQKGMLIHLSYLRSKFLAMSAIESVRKSIALVPYRPCSSAVLRVHN